MLEIKPHTRSIQWQIPSSKSHLARAIILSCYYQKEIDYSGALAQDTLDLIAALQKVDVAIEIKPTLIEINAESIWKKSYGICEIEIGEGATTLRFISLLLLQLDGKFHLKLGATLARRPHDELIKPFADNIKTNNQQITIRGQREILNNYSSFTIDCSQSTQFASSFLMNFSQSNIPVDFQSLSGSSTYLEMTKEMILEFQKNTQAWQCPRDWSSAAFAIAYGLIIGESTFKIEEDLFQADIKILELLKIIEADFEFQNQLMRISPSKKLKSFSFDFDHCPDLFPVACFIASFCAGESTLSGLVRLQFKESDRLSEMKRMLTHFGVTWKMVHDQLKIFGIPTLKVSSSSHRFADDHRIVMTQTLFCMKGEISTQLLNADCVNKSFPNFFLQICQD